MNLAGRASNEVFIKDYSSIDEWDDADFRSFNDFFTGELIDDMQDLMPFGSDPEKTGLWATKSFSLFAGSAATIDYIMRMAELDDEVRRALGVRVYRDNEWSYMGPFFELAAEVGASGPEIVRKTVQGEPIDALSEALYTITGLTPFQNTPIAGGLVSGFRNTLRSER